MIDFDSEEKTNFAATMHYDRDRSLHDMVREQAQAVPHATAVVFGDTALSYRDLDRVSDALAACSKGSQPSWGDDAPTTMRTSLSLPRPANFAI